MAGNKKKENPLFMKWHAIKCRGSSHSIDQFKDFLKSSKPILILRKYKGETENRVKKVWLCLILFSSGSFFLRLNTYF